MPAATALFVRRGTRRPCAVAWSVGVWYAAPGEMDWGGRADAASSGRAHDSGVKLWWRSCALCCLLLFPPSVFHRRRVRGTPHSSWRG